MHELAINLTVFSLILSVVRKSTRGKRGKSSNQVEELPENTPGEEPASAENMPPSVTNSVDITIKPEDKPEDRPEEENPKAEVTSASPITEIARTEEEKPNIVKQEDEVTVKESTAAGATTEQRAAIKGI